MPCMDPVDREIKFSTAKSSYDMLHLVTGREKPGISNLVTGREKPGISNHQVMTRFSAGVTVYPVMTKEGTQFS